MSRNWSEWWRARRADVAALAYIVICFGLMFLPSLARGRYPLVADSFCYSYPLRTEAFAMLLHGAWPLWTPYILSGYPLLSMAQVAVGYPLTWGYLVLPGHWAETIYILAPYLLAPAFTYAYCRELGRTRLAALFAGLAFGYGGLMFSKYTNNGMLSNAAMWLPLILIALERARRGRFGACLLGAACAYAMSVLSGIGQGFVFTGTVTLAYALFLGLALPRSADDDARASWWSWARWRPLAVMLGALLLATGVAAFQILETSPAVNRSIRNVLSYDTFVEGSMPPHTVWRSLLLPYANDGIDVTAYMATLAIGLALCGAILGGRRDVRVLFWLAIAAVAVVLMLGGNTPLYRIVYHVPVLNRFRVPARHTLEWSFALSVLAAYGWDALSRIVAGRKESRLWARRSLVVSLLVVLLAGAVGVCWWRAVGPPAAPYQFEYSGLTESSYLLWKATHTLLLLVGFCLGWRIAARRLRTGLLVAVILLACLTEPFMLLRTWWLPFHKTTNELSTPALATRYLQQFAPERHRVYTRVNLFTEQPLTLKRIDPHNLTILRGLHNVAGYEPLILERYSRALGKVGVDSVNPRPGFPRDNNLFLPRSHVLDLLNATFIVGYSNLSLSLGDGGSKDGIAFPAADLGVDLKPGETLSLFGFGLTGDALAVVSSLSNSTGEEDGKPIARVHILSTEGRTVELTLRAGQDTSEWAHERADVRPHIKHRLARVFDQIPGDASNTFPAGRYWTRLPLGGRLAVERVEITNLSQSASLALWKTVVVDAEGQTSAPLTTEREFPVALRDTTRWERALNLNNVLILRNTRALPRAWLVAEAEAVDSEEALKRIRGESATEFDPRRSALLEVPPQELPALSGGALSPESWAHITNYEPNRLRIETNSPTPTVLVVSENFYPGWEATVDGQAARINVADYLLRGVSLPAGRHTVEMRYTAPAARTGAIISIFTLLLLGGLFFYNRRRPPDLRQAQQLRQE